LNFFARARVSAHARLPVGQAKFSEIDDTHFFASDQAFADSSDEIVCDLGDLIFGYTGIIFMELFHDIVESFQGIFLLGF
jgi:hypothetical protein